MKKTIIGIILLPIFIFVIACDGSYSGQEIFLKSHIDGHSMTIKLDSKITDFHHGDILNPFFGRSTFKTKTKVGLSDLKDEIIDNNKHVDVDYVNSDMMVIFERTESGMTYSFYIKYLENIDNRNLFLAGEMNFSIESYNEEYTYEKILLPYHMIDDEDFDETIMNFQELNYDKEYRISNQYNTESFIEYYNNIGSYIVTKFENEIIVSGLNFEQPTSQVYQYIDSYVLDFSEPGKLIIRILDWY